MNRALLQTSSVQHIATPRGRVVKSGGARNLLTFLMVVGPGLIVMEADNDAGAGSTYVQAGAQYGTRLLWRPGRNTVLLNLLCGTCFSLSPSNVAASKITKAPPCR